jgi:hypothetical protein
VFVQHKRQTAEITVAFVIIVGMMFLVPAITGRALGETLAQVFRTNVDFTGKTYYLDAGSFVNSPPPDAFNDNKVYWSTMGGLIWGDEKGYVQYHVLTKDKKDLGTVTFQFSNPAKGANTCSVHASSGDVATKCSISQGGYSTVNYCVWYNSPGPTNCPVATSHFVEKKPISYVHTPSSGKTVLPHHQSHLSQSGPSTMAVSTPKTPSSTSGGTSSK